MLIFIYFRNFYFLFYSLLPFLIKVVEEQEINEGKGEGIRKCCKFYSNFCHPHKHHSSICRHIAFFYYLTLCCHALICLVFIFYILHLSTLSSHDAPASDIFDF